MEYEEQPRQIPEPPDHTRDGHPPVDGSAADERSSGGGWLRRFLVFAGIGLFVLSEIAPVGLAAVGRWLVIEDELAPADVIFVHAGHMPFRSMEAAEIYRDDWAREVWLAPIKPTPESEAMAELGIDRPPAEYWRGRILTRLGVPREAIRLLDTEVLTTEDEVRAVADELQRLGLDAAIFVTSKQHSRRVRMLWRRLAPAGTTAIVRPSAADPFDPEAWWTNTDDAQAVLHELAALAALQLGLDLRPKGD